MKGFFTSKRTSSDDLMNTTIFPKLSRLSHIDSYQTSPAHKVNHHQTIIDDIVKSHKDPYKEHRFIERGPLSYRQIRYKKVNEEQQSQVRMLSKDEIIQNQPKDQSNSKQQLKQWAANKKLLILSDEKMNSSSYSQNLLLPLTNRSHSNSQQSSKNLLNKDIFEVIQQSARSKLKEELSCFQSPLVQRSNMMLTRQQWNGQGIAKEAKQDNHMLFKSRKSIKDNENDGNSEQNLSFMYKILNEHSRPLLLQNHSPKLSKHNFLHGRRMPSYFHKI